MFGVAMAPSTGMKSLNSGWQVGDRYVSSSGARFLTRIQVWGGANASRHPSGSSATSIPESSMSHLNEAWGSRSASAGWEDVADAQQKDLSSLVREAVSAVLVSLGCRT